MLETCEVSSISDLFSDIDKSIKCKKLKLPKALSDPELEQFFEKKFKKNKNIISFLGGGVEKHYIPPVIDKISSLLGFYTSYTQYQSETSQGMLQALWEAHDCFSNLFGMKASTNTYDGATALSEAALLCARLHPKRNTFLIPESVSKEKKMVLSSYTEGKDLEIQEINFNRNTGEVLISDLEKKISDDVCGVYVESPNNFGVIEKNIKKIEETVHSKDAYLVFGPNPISLGFLKSPGELGADIVACECQPLGIYPCGGGPLLGIISVSGIERKNGGGVENLRQVIRKMPGRIIGMDTNRNFSIILQTREQHVARKKATSNICTNSALMAVRAGAFLSYYGPNGLKELYLSCVSNAEYFKKKVLEIDGIGLLFNTPHYEFSLKTNIKSKELGDALLEKSVHIGRVLDDEFPDLASAQVYCVTEANTKKEINKFARALSQVMKK